MRQVILFRGEDGFWVSEVPSLPGCISQGKARDEAVKNITEAAELWIEGMRAAGKRIPEDSSDFAVLKIAAEAA